MTTAGIAGRKAAETHPEEFANADDEAPTLAINARFGLNGLKAEHNGREPHGSNVRLGPGGSLNKAGNSRFQVFAAHSILNLAWQVVQVWSMRWNACSAGIAKSACSVLT